MFWYLHVQIHDCFLLFFKSFLSIFLFFILRFFTFVMLHLSLFYSIWCKILLLHVFLMIVSIVIIFYSFWQKMFKKKKKSEFTAITSFNWNMFHNHFPVFAFSVPSTNNKWYCIFLLQLPSQPQFLQTVGWGWGAWSFRYTYSTHYTPHICISMVWIWLECLFLSF